MVFHRYYTAWNVLVILMHKKMVIWALKLVRFYKFWSPGKCMLFMQSYSCEKTTFQHINSKDDGWLMAENALGEKGLIPGNFVKVPLCHIYNFCLPYIIVIIRKILRNCLGQLLHWIEGSNNQVCGIHAALTLIYTSHYGQSKKWKEFVG